MKKLGLILLIISGLSAQVVSQLQGVNHHTMIYQSGNNTKIDLDTVNGIRINRIYVSDSINTGGKIRAGGIIYMNNTDSVASKAYARSVAGGVTGSGTLGTIPIFTGSTAIGNSALTYSSGNWSFVGTIGASGPIVGEIIANNNSSGVISQYGIYQGTSIQTITNHSIASNANAINVHTGSADVFTVDTNGIATAQVLRGGNLLIQSLAHGDTIIFADQNALSLTLYPDVDFRGSPLIEGDLTVNNNLGVLVDLTVSGTANLNGPAVLTNTVQFSSLNGSGTAPVCMDAAGNAYRGTNTMGVLACP